ncbi:MAG: PD-(D/E)XK nuclease family protein, partial [Gemmatimonadota bacterium]|nr:PD-(D/E)XK nuclease family protein [Gemmatimonadota bacterium]
MRDVSIFCAANTADEIREVLRRAVGAGHALDAIEIASTDSDEYGVILEALCGHLGINATFYDGLPLAASRVARVLARWLDWIASGYRAEILQGALSAGDVPAHPAAASELRHLRIGWGLEATRRGLLRLESQSWRDGIKADSDEPLEAFESRRTARIAAMNSLRPLLQTLVANAPPPLVSVAALATRTSNVLELVTPAHAAEGSTLQRLRERLRDIASMPRGEVDLTDALATLQQELAELRVWTGASKTPKPRRATGGHVHLSNIENAGATGRPVLFIVGLDADRCAGPVMQSPLLPDTLRVRLNERGAGLATTEQRRRERSWQLANAVSSSHTQLTLSYARRGSGDGRDANAAPILLQAARRVAGQNDLSYDALHELIGSPVTPIPKPASAAIDARDVWFSAMSDGALLLDARPLLYESFPGLQRGRNALTARASLVGGAFHGIVSAAGGQLDPRKTMRAISPSSLEMLASCSMRWFYHVALGARVPDEPTFDALVWLNPLDRGRVLHDIYERLVAARLHEQVPSSARDRHVDRIVQNVLAETERDVPAPSIVVRNRESSDVHNNAALFVTVEHEAFLLAPWEVVELELKFGDEQAAELPLGDGTFIRVHGRVDRVDRLTDGTLRLIDYKTGRAFELDTKRGAFDGGRKLQLALYSPAVGALLKAEVSAAEYRFPTERGDGVVARADMMQLAMAPRIV